MDVTKVCYYALKPILVGDNDLRQPGELIPEATEWAFVRGYVDDGRIAPVLVATLPKSAREALRVWATERGYPVEQEEDMKDKTSAAYTSANAPTGQEVPLSEAEKSTVAPANPGDEIKTFGTESAIGRAKATDVMNDPDKQSSDAMTGTEAQQKASGFDPDTKPNTESDDDSDDDGEADADDYSAFTKDELKAELDGRSVEYKASANKDELIALLEEDDAAAK